MICYFLNIIQTAIVKLSNCKRYLFNELVDCSSDKNTIET